MSIFGAELTSYISSKKGELKAFDSVDYIASVQLTGSLKGYLENIPVGRNIPSAEMVVGRSVQVVMFDETNPKDAIITGVWT